jgi:DNA modification methylase
MAEPINTICSGDCIAGMNSLPAGSVDLVFADPPFNIGYDYDVYNDKLQTESYLGWSREWISAVHRALKPNGTFWLAIGDEYAAELKIESQRLGFHCRSWVIWYYTFGVNCSMKFTRSHAHLFHFVKDPKNFTFRADELENRIPSARQLVYNDNRANPRGRLPDDTWIMPPPDASGSLNPNEEGFDLRPIEDDGGTWTLRPQDLQSQFQPRDNTWYFPRVAGTFKERAGFHGCQMPEQLLARIIRVCSEPGAVVMDPFSGSGTTVAVAKKLGRKYLGFDLSPQYVELGMRRLSEISEGDPLDGSAEPLMSAPRTDQKRNRPKGKIETGASDSEQHRRIEAVARVVREAFRTTHDGWSADRLVVDPELNSSFVDACRALGAAGHPRDWNLLLFRLRKSGRLADFATARRTSISWQDCDEYLYASEIAWQMMVEEGRAGSLDEILCDPALASEFDAKAERFAPGFKSLNYRWAALKLRKQAKVACTRGANVVVPVTFGRAVPLAEFDWEAAAETPGVYVVGGRGPGKELYVGESVNLRHRLRRQFARRLQKVWKSAANERGLRGELCIRLSRPTPPDGMLAWQSYFVTRFEPPLNVRDLRATTT